MVATGRHILCFVKVTAIYCTCFNLQQGCADVAVSWINPWHIATAEFSGTTTGNQD
jgi:hypothetical protein